MVRALGTGLAASRIVFGLTFVAAPQRFGRLWLAGDAERPGGRAVCRGFGARDIGLGAGALRALARGEDARPWFAAQAVGEWTDVAATLAVRRRLPDRQVAFAVGMAGVAGLVALAATLGAGPEPRA
jgi:hypothetical protein